MITHEFEWGEDDEMFLAIGDDPLCGSCDKPLSLHAEVMGITHEDETLGDDNSWKESYENFLQTW